MLCQVGLTEIPEQLSKFHNLKRLHIGYNKIENIEYSETLQSLEVLGIKGNPLNEKSKSIVDKLEASGVRMI